MRLNHLLPVIYVATATAVDIATVYNVVTAVEVNCVVYVNEAGSSLSETCSSSEPLALAPTSSGQPTAASTLARTTPHGVPSHAAGTIPAVMTSTPNLHPTAPPPHQASTPTSEGINFNPSTLLVSSIPAPSSQPPASSGRANGYGIAYSPYNSDNSCKSQSQVSQDINNIPGDYGLIRLYGTDCNQVSNVLNALGGKSTKLFLGVYDPSQVSSDVQTIIDAAKGDWSKIDTVSIGNEGVNDGTYTVPEVVSAIGQARSQLASAGYQGKVVTVDTFVAMIANPELCQASDYAAANCHAFFDGGVTADHAGAFVLGQAQRVSQACGGKDTMITESGWPSQGQANRAAVPSPENQQAAIDSLKATFSSNLILFSAFNDLWKHNSADTFGAEQYWGIYGNAPS